MMQQPHSMPQRCDSRTLAPHGPPACVLAKPPPLRVLPHHGSEQQAIPPHALFLDFDGTLVEIADHPDRVEVAPGMPDMLQRLDHALDGRLAVISGRSVSVLDRLLGPTGISMAGSHGGEFRPAGADKVEALADPLPRAVSDRLHRFAHDAGGLLVELKPFSTAVHYRAHPEACARLLACAGELAETHGLGLKHGKMVVELVMPGSDKGSAVTKFMGLPGFAASRPWFAGDDVTDEDAFKAVTRYGGGGILVGPLRETAALWHLSDVAALHDWLAEALK